MIGDLKPYPAYKDSGIPWLRQVPAAWELRRIKTLFREKDERSGQKEGLLLSLTRTRGLTPLAAASNRLSSAEDLSRYKVCQPGDIVMNRMQAWSGMFALSSYKGLVSPDYSVFTTIALSNPKYFEYLFRAPLLVEQFAQRSKGIGSGFNRLYTADFGALHVMAPPLPEQSAIIRFLDYADRRIQRNIRAKKKLIALLNEQKQAIIHHAVTRGLDPNVRFKPSGLEWLAEVPEQWDVRKLGSIASVFNGSTPSRMQPSYWRGGDIPWLASGKVNDYLVEAASEFVTIRALQECSISLVPKGSVILGLVGQGRTRGMSALLGIDACINQNLAAIVPHHEIDGRFLHHLLTSLYAPIREIGRGGNQEALNCELVARLRLPLPPLTEQLAICEHLHNRLAGLVGAHRHVEAEINLLHEYRLRLIADVVTGKLDVREPAARLPEEVEESELIEAGEATIYDTDDDEGEGENLDARHEEA